MKLSEMSLEEATANDYSKGVWQQARWQVKHMAGKNNPFYGKKHPRKGKTYEECYGEKKGKEVKEKIAKNIRENQAKKRKGKTFEEIYGAKKAKEIKEKQTKGQKQHHEKNPERKKLMGKRTKELWKNPKYRKRMVETRIGKKQKSDRKGMTYEEYYGKETAERMKKITSQKNKGNESWLKDKTYQEAYGEQRAKKLIKKRSGKKSHLWKDGASFGKYGVEFNNQLKREIRKRDNLKCRLCGEKENGRKLDSHHIDSDKNNNKSENLIALCHSCHMKVHSQGLELIAIRGA